MSFTRRTRERVTASCMCVAASTKIEQINDVFSKTRIMSLPLFLTHRFIHFFTFTYIHFYLTFLFISPDTLLFIISLIDTCTYFFLHFVYAWSSDFPLRNEYRLLLSFFWSQTLSRTLSIQTWKISRDVKKFKTT